MIPSSVRIFVCTERQDMRRSFDALALIVRESVLHSILRAVACSFLPAKRAIRLKVLWFDRNGYCILYKRLHRAHFELPDATDSKRPMASIDAQMLAMLLRGVER